MATGTMAFLVQCKSTTIYFIDWLIANAFLVKKSFDSNVINKQKCMFNKNLRASFLLFMKVNDECEIYTKKF